MKLLLNGKLHTLALAGAIALFVAAAPSARALTVISNLGQSQDDQQGIYGSSVEGTTPTWAQPFVSGTANLTLSSVTLDFGQIISGTGVPVTPNAPITIAIYDSVFSVDAGGYVPNAALVTLSPTNSFPAASGTSSALYTYTASGGLSLSASTQYFIVASTASTNADAYTVNLTASASFDAAPLSGWTVANSPQSAYFDTDASGWLLFDGESLRFSVDAIPEPATSVLALGGMVAGGLLLRRRKR